MEARIVNTPSAALDNEPARCFFAIELSKTSWLVAAQGPTGNVRRYQLPGCDANALLELIERIRTRVERETARPDRMERLDHLRTGNGQALRVRLKAEIERELERLQLVLEMIVSLEAERNAITKDKAPTAHLHADKIRKLVRLKAIGPEFSTALVGEVFYRQFANRRQIGSYVGLTPSPFSSGALAGDQGISKAGNPKPPDLRIRPAWT